MSRSFSSVSSVLEESDLEQQQSEAGSASNAYYENEQFESQSEDGSESTEVLTPGQEELQAVSPLVVNSSDSDNYDSDGFEDEQEAHHSASFGVVSVSGDVENSGNYDGESFEGEEEAAALGVQRSEQEDILQVTEEENEYVDESFEGEEVTYEHEDAGALGVQIGISQASDEDNYDGYDDELFEDQETTEEEVATVLEAQSSFSQVADEANDYSDESFEGEVASEEEGKTSLTVQAGISQATSDENDYDDESFEGEKTTDGQGDESPPDVQVAPESNLHPELSGWCFRKIHELRSSKSEPGNARLPVLESRIGVGKIPAVAVKELIHRTSSGRRLSRQRQQSGSSRFLSHQKLKIPTSLVARAQTQQWLAKGSQSLDPPPAPTRSVASTFYSVKCDELRGRLATIRLSEGPGLPDPGDFSIETLGWVQKVATKQRQVANYTTEDSGGRRLFEVEMATRLQLEDSIALRHQAATLLAKLST
ncbi:hypothetical protein DVH05_027035 [Phytophthora capsici]|nr:hypothetical protein DVH05_027035 [Phytophthora capsici]